MQRYRNPYDFVPLEEHPTSLAAKLSLASAAGLSGRITFQLIVLTPLCIHNDPGKPDQRNSGNLYRFAHLGGKPRIPATSLKGMLRGVHEALTNSTLGIINRRAWYAGRIPEDYLSGGKTFTPSDALFGMVSASKQQFDVGRAGRLLIDDLTLPGNVTLAHQDVSRPAGGQPKPAHESFYFHPDGKRLILGRKFYYHQQNFRETLAIYRRRRMPEIVVEAVPIGSILTGTLRFSGLSEGELDSLIYALILEHGTAHKLGYGKPLGLGSLEIRITQLHIESALNDVPARFLSYGESTLEDRSAEVQIRRDRARDEWQRRAGGGAASHAAFVSIAHWPQTENFVYPDFDYFRSQRGRTAQDPIWEYQGRAESDYYPGAAGLPSVTGGPSASTLSDPIAASALSPELQLPSERRRGRFDRRGGVGISVQDEADERIYQARPTDAASRKLLRRLSDQLDTSDPPLVSFRLEIGADVDGKRVPVAVDLRMEGAA